MDMVKELLVGDPGTACYVFARIRNRLIETRTRIVTRYSTLEVLRIVTERTENIRNRPDF
jgi:hypothetical protein